MLYQESRAAGTRHLALPQLQPSERHATLVECGGKTFLFTRY